jgi:hypothetical protein
MGKSRVFMGKSRFFGEFFFLDIHSKKKKKKKKKKKWDPGQKIKI